ncbi:MAG: S-layer domain protein, partial [Glaciihabitans sp.]|nr:S-layer domain protein [Glaciihabitans sp.]
MTLTSAFARRFSNVALRSSNAAPLLARTRRITVLAALTTLAVAFGVLTATPAAAAAPATTNNIALNVVVAIPADWGTKANNWTTERIVKTLNASGEYWSTMTGGTTGFDVPATIKTVKTAAESTDPGKTILDTVVAEQGFDETAQWKGLIVFVPQAKVASGTGSPAAAMSYNNNLQSGGYMIVADENSAQNTLTNLVAHEFGHFFMIPHANRLGCSDGSTDSLPATSATGWSNTSCATVEYDDNNDVMSNAYSLGSLNTYLTESAGFAKTGSIQTVTPTTKTSTYSLQPWGNTTANGVRSIKVIDPANGTPYYVELRQAVGIDKNDATGVRAGVKIVKKNSGPQGGSVVIDPTPTTLSGNTDGKQTWEAGSSFTTASNSTRIDIESINANSAKVSVTDIRAGRGAAAGVASPIVTATSNSGAAWYTGNSYIDVTAKDSAGAAIPGTVSVYRGGVYLADVTIGTSGTTRYTLPLNTEAGTYSFTLIHSNTAVRSGQITHTIVKSSTTTNVVKAPATLAPGETGAIDVRVTIPSGVPLIGSVAASIDGAAAETVALPDAKGGLGTLSLGKLSNGLHHVEFQYAGERNSLPSVGKATVSVTNGTITVVSTGPSTYKGSQGKLTVSAKSTAGKPVTGSVTASENGTQIGKATLSAQGTGTIYLSKSLAVGRHSILVHHSDSSVADATVIHTVARATATVSGSASKATIPANNSTATISVTTSAASGAYGSVQVLRNGELAATRTVSAANKGAFVYAIGELDAGSYTYTLKYLGSKTVAPASST